MASLKFLLALIACLASSPADADPVITPLVTAALASAGVAATATVAGISVVALTSFLVQAALIVGASYLVNTLRQSKSNISPDTGPPAQLQIKQPNGPRISGIGRMKLGGSLAFMETTGGSLFQVWVHCVGPIDQIEEWWLNDTKVNFIEGQALDTPVPNNVTPWGGSVTIESHLGAVDQLASADLMGYFSGIWTSDHKLRGLAYSILRCSHVPSASFQSVFPNGVPGLRVVGRLDKLYDPRTLVTSWSDNASLGIRHFLTSLDKGYQIDSSLIDDASFAAFADTCGDLVDDGNGGTEARYRLWGVFAYSEERRDILRRMLLSCDAELYLTGEGKIGIRSGHSDPTVTITDDDITELSIEEGSGKFSAFNQVKFKYLEPDQDYQIIDGEPFDDEANQLLRGETLTTEIEFAMCPSHSQGRRLAKIAIRKGNPDWRINLSTGPKGIDAFGERFIRLVINELALDITCMVMKFEVIGEADGARMGLVSLADDTYDFDAPTEAGTSAPVPPSTTTPYVIPVPANLVLTQPVGTRKIRATIDPPTDTALGTRVRYRVQGTTPWFYMAKVQDWVYEAPDLISGSIYEVQAAHVAGGKEGTYTAIQTITMAAASVTSYGANFGDGASLTYTITHNLNSLDVGVEVYRNSGSNDTIVCDVGRVDVNNIMLTFDTAPTTNQFRVVVQV